MIHIRTWPGAWCRRCTLWAKVRQIPGVRRVWCRLFGHHQSHLNWKYACMNCGLWPSGPWDKPSRERFLDRAVSDREQAAAWAQSRDEELDRWL